VALPHIGNIAHRVGQQASPEQIKASIKDCPEAAEAFERMQKHLETNEIKLDKDKAVLGPWLTIDSRKERFVGPFAEQANKLLKREQYRAPFVVPEKV